jgi:hypothetical protein
MNILKDNLEFGVLGNTGLIHDSLFAINYVKIFNSHV